MENVSFLKRKKTLFQDANKFTTQTGTYVGVILFSPGEKSRSYGSTSIKNIIVNFLKVKVEDRQLIMLRANQIILRHWKISIKNCKHVTEKKKESANA